MRALLPSNCLFLTCDGFLDDPDAVRQHALGSEFIDWEGHDGQVYRRVCLTEVPGLQRSIERVCGPIQMFGRGYRLNYAGEPPNQAIHSDLGWGTHAAVVYLCDGAGGTAFWRHKATGATAIRQGDAELFEALSGDWERPDSWEMSGLAEMRLNRGVIYDGSHFHSRYPFEAFGSSPHDGRLIAVAFFSAAEAE